MLNLLNKFRSSHSKSPKSESALPGYLLLLLYLEMNLIDSFVAICFKFSDLGKKKEKKRKSERGRKKHKAISYFPQNIILF